MHRNAALLVDRLARTLSDVIEPAIRPARVPLRISAWHVPGEPVPFAEAAQATYDAFVPGTAWGPAWSTSWLKVEGTVPSEWAGRHVEASIDLGFRGDWPGNQAEALAFGLDGCIVKAISPMNRHLPVADPADGGERVAWLLEAAANPDILDDARGNTPQSDLLTRRMDPLYRFGHADLVVVDDDVWHTWLDLAVLGELARSLSDTDPRHHQLFQVIERALNRLDHRDVAGSAPAMRAELRVAFDGHPATASAHTVHAVSNAHIDTAWLWPLRETRRKCARTFSNALALMQHYPDYRFACPQAQQSDWIKREHPELWGRIVEAARDGRWLPTGGMWVEADGNLPGGEALVRQLVLGKRFFRDELGCETRGVWLPDSFGYTAAYPQLARLAGNEWFLTQKISWNQTNTFPHHTFWWEGIDGTRIFTHFPPADTYTGNTEVAELQHAARTFRDAGPATVSLYPYGYGDGGGGPTREMLERLRRMADLEGLPRVRLSSPDEFFAAANAEYANAPVWSGELYLELHRGTFTSQARTKAGNRRTEHLLRAAELWATTAAVATGRPYPYDELDSIWREALTLQFHDILPGSSIGWVHREAEEAYARLSTDLEALILGALAALPDGMSEYANTAPLDRVEVTEAEDGNLVVACAPAQGVGRAITTPEGWGVGVVEDATGWLLDNGMIGVHIDRDGLISSVVDHRANDREIVPTGQRANLLQAHPDHPNSWDAWDVDVFYRDRVMNLTAASSVELLAKGPLRATVRVIRQVGNSTIEQRLTLDAGTPRIDIATEVDWQERETFLKAAFPVDLHADTVSAEIQFGHVRRTLLENTSWDWARFENWAHRWVHVAEPGYGIALITDSTYGHDASRSTDNVGGRAKTTTILRLSLLRSPNAPDPEADRGRHAFTYSLAVGATIDDAIHHGYVRNLPLRALARRVESAPLICLDDVWGTPLIEAVKLADDRSGDVIVRIYEGRGGRATARLRAAFPIVDAWVCNLLEDAADGTDTLRTTDLGYQLNLRPFQVVTLRLRRA